MMQYARRMFEVIHIFGTPFAGDSALSDKNDVTRLQTTVFRVLCSSTMENNNETIPPNKKKNAHKMRKLCGIAHTISQ